MGQFADERQRRQQYASDLAQASEQRRQATRAAVESLAREFIDDLIIRGAPGKTALSGGAESGWWITVHCGGDSTVAFEVFVTDKGLLRGAKLDAAYGCSELEWKHAMQRAFDAAVDGTTDRRAADEAKRRAEADQLRSHWENYRGTATLVLGCVGMTFIPIVAPISAVIAIVLGHMGLTSCRKGFASNRGMAIAGTILGYIHLLIAVAFVVNLVVFVRKQGLYG